MTKILLFSLLLFTAPYSWAEGIVISVGGGSNNSEISIATSISERFDVRVGYSSSRYMDFTFKQPKRYTDTYNSRQESALLLDWHPYDNEFKTSFGFVYYQAKHQLSKPSAITKIVTTTTRDGGFGSFIRCLITLGFSCEDPIISETTTSTPWADFGTHNYEVSYRVYAPYLGVGYSTQAKRKSGYYLTADLGVFYRDYPNVTTSFTCGSSNPPGTPTCNAYQNALVEESEAMKANFSKWMPKLSIGVQYIF